MGRWGGELAPSLSLSRQFPLFCDPLGNAPYFGSLLYETHSRSLLRLRSAQVRTSPSAQVSASRSVEVPHLKVQTSLQQFHLLAK